MFIGHYGVSLAAKRLAPGAPLAALFVAVQLVDVLFAIFVALGVEKMRIAPGFTKTNPYDLYFMPYTHSLAGAVLWAAVAAIAYAIATGAGGERDKVLAAVVVGLAVASHFALDFVVHTPDLPLGFDPGSPRVGLGLWNQVDVTIALELGTVAAGGAIYVAATDARDASGDRATLVVGAVLAAFAVATPFLPVPEEPLAWAAQALAAYAALAQWMDAKRAPAVA
jgi:hypothetical protein